MGEACFFLGGRRAGGAGPVPGSGGGPPEIPNKVGAHLYPRNFLLMVGGTRSATSIFFGAKNFSQDLQQKIVIYARYSIPYFLRCTRSAVA